MATLRIKYLATSIKMQMHLQVFLPDSIASGSGARLRVLWLLHGEGGDCSDWSRLSMVEHHAEAANIALVLPDLGNSMAMDMAHGGYPYFTYLTEDLPVHLRNLVRVLSDRREDNFVAGVGTGGYGAAKWLLRAPEAFAAAACLSGDVDMVSALRERAAAGTLGDDLRAAFGDADRLAGSRDDPMRLVTEPGAFAHGAPRLVLVGGAADEGAGRRRAAADRLRAAGAEVDFDEVPGIAGWRTWDAAIADFIATVVTADQRVEV